MIVANKRVIDFNLIEGFGMKLNVGKENFLKTCYEIFVSCTLNVKLDASRSRCELLRILHPLVFTA